MSFLAKFKVDNEEMNVLEYNMSMNQNVDHSGKPSSDPMGGQVRLVVELSKSTLLYQWMASPTQMKDGFIKFFRRDGMSRLRELEFKKAYCIAYNEVFMAYDDTPLCAEITITAKEISINGESFNKNWAVKL